MTRFLVVLPQTSEGNVYTMIMIEKFSKWVELVTLPDKSSLSTSHAFLQQVLSRFGACVKCLTNQGSKFRGEFQDLLDHALIDHCQTSRDHPQVDGLAERMVQTCKKGLQKICLIKNKEDWDMALLYIAMGYRMSRHAYLSHFFPYFLLFGRHPIPPSSIATQIVATPLWRKCEAATHIPENGIWKSSRTLKNSERDCRGQKTLHWGVLYTIEKVLKCRSPKWPCMNHLDICNTSYGRKKGWESNWQFDSRPLKVGNRPNSGACRWSATQCWKSLEESYNFGLNLVPIRVWGEEL